MPDVTIDWLAIVISVVAAMVIGAVWYAPPVFGARWMGYIGKTKEQLREGGSMGYLVAILGAFLTALVLTYVIGWSDSTSTAAGALTGAVMWLGFTVPSIMMNGAFEGRPWGLTLINSANSLVTLMVMGAIIGSMA